MWKEYPNNPKVHPDYTQPPERDGTIIDYDSFSGTLDGIRAAALTAYEIESQMQAERDRVDAFRQVDEIYATVAIYVALLETTGWPGGMMLDIVPDDISPASFVQSDTIRGVLWPLVDDVYNNNESPHLAIGPDRRIYVKWMRDNDDANLTYKQAAYAPADLYDEELWAEIDDIHMVLDELELPVECDFEASPVNAVDRNGVDLPHGIDLARIRAEAMAAYKIQPAASKRAETKPTVAQIDELYRNARLLAELWRESGTPDAVVCKTAPDEIDLERLTQDQLVNTAMLPLNHSGESYLDNTPDYMLGPEGRIYEVRGGGYDEATQSANFFYVPVDLYDTDHAKDISEVIARLDDASKATH